MVTCSYSFLSNLQFALKYILNRRKIAIYIAILSSLLATFVSFYIILISELYCKSLCYDFLRARLLLIHPISSILTILFRYLSFLILSRHIFPLCTLLTQCSPCYSIFAFPLNAIYFPLSRARGPSPSL